MGNCELACIFLFFLFVYLSFSLLSFYFIVLVLILFSFFFFLFFSLLSCWFGYEVRGFHRLEVDFVERSFRYSHCSYSNIHITLPMLLLGIGLSGCTCVYPSGFHS